MVQPLPFITNFMARWVWDKLAYTNLPFRDSEWVLSLMNTIFHAGLIAQLWEQSIDKQWGGSCHVLSLAPILAY